MKKSKLAYWIPTGLLALLIFVSGVANVTHQARPVEAALHLGYPPYLVTELGIWKLLAAVTFVFGARWPHLREWAFAGVFFDLSGAVVAHVASGDGFADTAPAAVLLVVTVVAYAAWRRYEPWASARARSRAANIAARRAG